jgi:hypothetical protein
VLGTITDALDDYNESKEATRDDPIPPSDAECKSMMRLNMIKAGIGEVSIKDIMMAHAAEGEYIYDIFSMPYCHDYPLGIVVTHRVTVAKDAARLAQV